MVLQQLRPAQRAQDFRAHWRSRALQLVVDPVQEKPPHLLLAGSPQGEGLLKFDPGHVGVVQLQIISFLSIIIGIFNIQWA